MNENGIKEYVASRPVEDTARQDGIFAKVWNHFLVENGVFAFDGDCCKYRWDDGARCAAGLFIPDALYEPAMESNTIHILVRTGAMPGVVLDDVLLLESMQRAHDEVVVAGIVGCEAECAAFREHMIGIAEDFDLLIPEDA